MKEEVPSPTKRKPVTDPAAPPLLTSTFRPKELLRRVRRSSSVAPPPPPPASSPTSGSSSPTSGSSPALAPFSTCPPSDAPPSNGSTSPSSDGSISPSTPSSAPSTAPHSAPDAKPSKDKGDPKEKGKERWEFVPTRVPDGISLRNFGIQVVSFLSYFSSFRFFFLFHFWLMVLYFGFWFGVCVIGLLLTSFFFLLIFELTYFVSFNFQMGCTDSIPHPSSSYSTLKTPNKTLTSFSRTSSQYTQPSPTSSSTHPKALHQQPSR